MKYSRWLISAAFFAESTSAFTQTTKSFHRSPTLSLSLDDDDDFSDAGLQRQLRSRRTQGTSPKDLVPNGIGIGTRAWGDPERGCFDAFNPADLQGAYSALANEGLVFFDTGETYGQSSRDEGYSAEQLLGQFASTNFKTTPKFATTFTPSLFRSGSGAVVKALEESLDRLGVGFVDLYQVEAPRLGSRTALYKGLAECKNRGLCNAVGVTNCNAKQVAHAHAGLKALGIPLASNRVELSLLEQSALEDGTVDACKRLGVTVLAGSPLKGGLASGRYTAKNPTGGKFLGGKKKGKRKASPYSTPSSGGGGPPSMRRVPGSRYTFAELTKTLPLHNALGAVARNVMKRGGEAVEGKTVTPAQVALNWVVAKGAVPLVGVNSVADAQEVVGCVGWRLRAADMELLEEAVEEGKNTQVYTRASYDSGDFLKY